jgi:DNA-binding transcriptional MerR regulator/methylmalonyl-CoA mutase cobalamin-binding subunit
MDKIVGQIHPTSRVSIATVERETGLSKDTLRVWERRYGFPAPLRDGNGERAYSRAQLDKLRLIRRCMDLGLRPGKIVGASLHELSERIAALDAGARASAGAADGGPGQALIDMLKARQLIEMRDSLAQAMMRLGVQRFLIDVVAPLSAEVGRAWMRGEIEIHEEHLYSEQINHLLRQAISSCVPAVNAPRLLLTTLPGEEHQLGLLMAQAYLSVEGVHCISLGVQTPAFDVVRAASALGADIVGLSFSLAHQPRTVLAQLAELRDGLKPEVALWAGGTIVGRLRKVPDGVRLLASLADTTQALADWRARRHAQAA